MSKKVDGEPFRAALQRAINASPLTQEAIGERVAALEGRPKPYPQTTVSTWTRRDDLLTGSAARIFAVEEVLELEPGALSQLAGFVPLEVAGERDVEAAIRGSADLTRTQREDLIAVYQTFVSRNG